jgi:hypothetical protein
MIRNRKGGTMEKAPKYTPAPLTFDEDTGDTGRIYIYPEGDPCFYVAELHAKREDPDGRYPTRMERLANAALFCAAPELLEAAQAVIGFADGWAQQDANTPEEELERKRLQLVCDQLRYAITKASGKVKADTV